MGKEGILGRRRATVRLVDEGEGAEAHKAFVKVERMTMEAVAMALFLVVLLSLMAVARTHEVEGRRMLLQVSSAADIPKKEYNKLCKKYYDEDLGNCLDSKVLRAYNKQVKSKKAEEKKDDEKKEREKKEREKERNDKDDNDSSSSNDNDDDNDSGGGGGGDAISFDFMSTFPASTNSQPAFSTD